MAADASVDAVVAIHIPPLAGREDDRLAAVGARAAEVGVPVVAVPLAQATPAGLAEQMAVLATPEDAARALGRVAGYARYLARPADPAPPPPRGRVRLELDALRMVWDRGRTNVHVMLPFVRTARELERCRALVAQSGLLDRPGFKLWAVSTSSAARASSRRRSLPRAASQPTPGGVQRAGTVPASPPYSPPQQRRD